jgi:hypothetical protein
MLSIHRFLIALGTSLGALLHDMPVKEDLNRQGTCALDCFTSYALLRLAECANNIFGVAVVRHARDLVLPPPATLNIHPGGGGVITNVTFTLYAFSERQRRSPVYVRPRTVLEFFNR